MMIGELREMGNWCGALDFFFLPFPGLCTADSRRRSNNNSSSSNIHSLILLAFFKFFRSLFLFFFGRLAEKKTAAAALLVCEAHRCSGVKRSFASRKRRQDKRQQRRASKFFSSQLSRGKKGVSSLFPFFSRLRTLSEASPRLSLFALPSHLILINSSWPLRMIDHRT
jgi:hypothetical protein